MRSVFVLNYSIFKFILSKSQLILWGLTMSTRKREKNVLLVVLLFANEFYKNELLIYEISKAVIKHKLKQNTNTLRSRFEREFQGKNDLLFFSQLERFFNLLTIKLSCFFQIIFFYLLVDLGS